MVYVASLVTNSKLVGEVGIWHCLSNGDIVAVQTFMMLTQVVREFLEDFGEKTVVSNKRQRR